jgi:hypothetical protein
MRKKRGRGRPPKANPKDPKAAGRKAKQREWDQWEEAKLRQLRALDEGIAPHQLNIDLLADVWRDVTMDQVTRVLQLEERIDWPRFFIKHLKLHAKIDKLKLTKPEEIMHLIETELEKLRKSLRDN